MLFSKGLCVYGLQEELELIIWNIRSSSETMLGWLSAQHRFWLLSLPAQLEGTRIWVDRILGERTQLLCNKGGHSSLSKQHWTHHCASTMGGVHLFISRQVCDPWCRDLLVLELTHRKVTQSAPRWFVIWWFCFFGGWFRFPIWSLATFSWPFLAGVVGYEIWDILPEYSHILSITVWHVINVGENSCRTVLSCCTSQHACWSCIHQELTSASKGSVWIVVYVCNLLNIIDCTLFCPLWSSQLGLGEKKYDPHMDRYGCSLRD